MMHPERESNSDIVGFGGVWIVTEEAHVINIVIMPEVQRQGLGLRVLECLQAEAERRGAVTIAVVSTVSVCPCKNSQTI